MISIMEDEKHNKLLFVEQHRSICSQIYSRLEMCIVNVVVLILRFC